MTIEIPAEFRPFIEAIIRNGTFKSEVDVVREGLRLLQEREHRLTLLREELKPALEGLDRGEGIRLDGDAKIHEFFEDLRTRGQERLAERKKSARQRNAT
ncbi:MAG: type II toxin-antitoxin system ParD family antitoxin [Thermoguttaceae bacterium]|jgi:putative addiction module CopG family antidote